MKVSEQIKMRVATLGLETFNSSIAHENEEHSWSRIENVSTALRKMQERGEVVELGKLDDARYTDTWGRQIATKLMRYKMTGEKKSKASEVVENTLEGWRDVYPEMFLPPPVPKHGVRQIRIQP